MSKIYKFVVPKPSAKRLEANKKFIVEVYGSWPQEYVYEINPDQMVVLWVGPDQLQHHDRELLDADYEIRFFVEFSNVTGSRHEKLPVVAEEAPLNETDFQGVLQPPSAWKEI